MGKKINTEQLERMLEAGVSQAEIARRFQVSESAISQAVKKLGIGKAQKGDTDQEQLSRLLAWAREQGWSTSKLLRGLEGLKFLVEAGIIEIED